MRKWLIRKWLMFFTFFIIYGCATQATSENRAATVSKSFSVYALSRGQGVPPIAEKILQRVEHLLARVKAKGVAVDISKSVIGLEGETKLCATFTDNQAADELLTQIQELVKGGDLINVVIEPCAK